MNAAERAAAMPPQLSVRCRNRSERAFSRLRQAGDQRRVVGQVENRIET